jgi:hypothetical protein
MRADRVRFSADANFKTCYSTVVALAYNIFPHQDEPCTLHFRIPQKSSTLEPHLHRTCATQNAGSNEPAWLSTLVHTCYTHTPAISNTRMVPHGPHHARVTKNTATPANHSLYKLPTQEARFLQDSHKPQSRINTPMPTDDHTTSLPHTLDSNVQFRSKHHHVTYKCSVTTTSRWTLYTYCI